MKLWRVLAAAPLVLSLGLAGCATTTADDDDDDDDDSTPVIDSEWEDLSLGLNVTLNGIWGSAPTAMWMVGSNGSIFRTDGASVRPASLTGLTEDLNGIWGTSDGSMIMVVGENGTVLTNTDGTLEGFQPLDFPFNSSLTSVWGFSANDIWVAGFGGLAHWDGADWSAIDLPVNSNLRSVWGTSADDLWVVGDEGTILHRTASGWQDLSTGVTADNFNDVWGAEGNAYVVGESGSVLWSSGGQPVQAINPAVSSIPIENTFWSVWAGGGGQVFAGGMNGHVYSWEDRTNAEFEDLDTGEVVVSVIYDLWGFTPNDVWAVGNRGTLLRRRITAGE